MVNAPSRDRTKQCPPPLVSPKNPVIIPPGLMPVAKVLVEPGGWGAYETTNQLTIKGVAYDGPCRVNDPGVGPDKGGIKRGDSAVASANKAVFQETCVNVTSGDHSGRANASRKRVYGAGWIERGKSAVWGSNETRAPGKFLLRRCKIR